LYRKKVEKQTSSDTDYVLTFEELAALIDAKAIETYAQLSMEATPQQAIRIFQVQKIEMTYFFS